VVAWLDRQPVESLWVTGIALAPDATLATRNVRHLGDVKLSVVDPWIAQQRQFGSSSRDRVLDQGTGAR
jgi:hypothetical protein